MGGWGKACRSLGSLGWRVQLRILLPGSFLVSGPGSGRSLSGLPTDVGNFSESFPPVPSLTRPLFCALTTGSPVRFRLGEQDWGIGYGVLGLGFRNLFRFRFDPWGLFGSLGGSPTTESPAPLARGSLSAPWASCLQASSRPRCLEIARSEPPRSRSLIPKPTVNSKPRTSSR